jgi:hypothetical protein
MRLTEPSEYLTDVVPMLTMILMDGRELTRSEVNIICGQVDPIINFANLLYWGVIETKTTWDGQRYVVSDAGKLIVEAGYEQTKEESGEPQVHPE